MMTLSINIRTREGVSMKPAIGFTGTQQGMTKPQILKVSKILEVFAQYERGSVPEFHSGDCIGADAEAHALAHALAYYTVGHPPDNPSKRAFLVYDEERISAPYMERNTNIVRATDILIGTPKGFQSELRSGTWATLRRARHAQRIIFIVWPDGTVRLEKGST